MTFAYAVAVLIGSFVYSAIFVALSAATSRGLVIGLGYSLLWEGLLSGALKGTQLFSVREYIRGMASALAPRGSVESVVGAYGFVFAAVAIVVVTALASWRLARYEIRAAE
jgi:ABC-2 type transport system permease protein